MSINIVSVKSKKDLNQFIKFPWLIYKGDPNWVPPLISEIKNLLNPKKHPFHEHAEVELFLAKRDGGVVGRIAAIINDNHIKEHNEKAGFFGFFECINDYQVAEKLFDTVRDWLKERGMEIMRGPMNFSVNEECGLLVNGFDSPPVVMMTYNPRYYLELIDRYRFVKARNLYAYYMDDKAFPERFGKVIEAIKKRTGVSVRKIKMKDFDNEVKRVKLIYNAAWSQNWGAIPMTDNEFDKLAKDMKMILDPDLALIAEIGGKPVGFSLTIPNVNEALIKLNGRLFPLGIFKLLWHFYVKKFHSTRTIIMGVIEEHRHKGIDSIFYYQTFKDGTAKGYWWGEMSWILEDNLPMVRALEKMGARIYKTYRIYDYALTSK
ncbi:N-acetyltransferase [candidate division KSB1 bacterium]|nr:N-acetyltransferase [candidate division KSB1 bacterium]